MGADPWMGSTLPEAEVERSVREADARRLEELRATEEAWARQHSAAPYFTLPCPGEESLALAELEDGRYGMELAR